ncbi:hypothetical protein LTS10_002419 [Elasticomyces elasticus]|nr:hypothetical protein LTS10_002419 [Elasticomyces elasticus]
MADSTGTPPQAWAQHQAALWALSSRDECEFQMADDAPPNSNAHRSDLSRNSNIGENLSFGSASAPGASVTEQKPAGIASIDKGMIGIQREIASVKEQVNALPGIFAVLPEFIGREVVSHVENELLEPLGQRVSDLEQKFDGLQEVEEKESTEEVSLLHEPTEAPVATFDLNSLETKACQRKRHIHLQRHLCWQRSRTSPKTASMTPSPAHRMLRRLQTRKTPETTNLRAFPTRTATITCPSSQKVDQKDQKCGSHPGISTAYSSTP